MIEYNFELEFCLENEAKFADWIKRIIGSEGCFLGDISYIFCGDDYLLEMNKKYLEHDTYTDIITFDYTNGNLISGDIFISVERVRENALEFGIEFQEELLRVMSHGILHLMGYKDKTEGDIGIMRDKENEMMKLFHVEH